MAKTRKAIVDNHGFRYYDPEIGRYLTRDPAGYVDGLNVYLYVHNNPINFYDPEGLGYWSDVGQVYMGYGDAAVGMVGGMYTLARHPVQTVKGVGTAVAHPIQTATAIKNSYVEKAQTPRGQGEIIGEVLITAATIGAGMAEQSASKAGQVARVASEIDAAAPDEVAAYADDVVRATVNPEGVVKNTFTKTEFDGLKVYQRSDIEWGKVDAMGRSNAERVQQGLAPVGKDGQPINLHHVGQDSKTVAEATQTTHQQGAKTLHKNLKESAIDRDAFNKWKRDYWKQRETTKK